jgi:hypothetical protein
MITLEALESYRTIHIRMLFLYGIHYLTLAPPDNLLQYIDGYVGCTLLKD